jgi:hypothetical protein
VSVYTGVYGATYPPGSSLPAPGLPWRFCYANPQPAGGILGEFAQAQSRTLILRAGPGNFHEASVNIDGRSLAAVSFTELQNDMVVLYGTQLMFVGRIAPTQDDLDAAAHRVQVTALDYRELLRRRAIYTAANFTAVDQSLIALTLINTAQGLSGGDLGIVAGTGATTGVSRTWNAVKGDFVGAKIDELAQMDSGFDWDITPTGLPSGLRFDVFYPSSSRGSNRGTVLQYGDAYISRITRVVDPSQFADAIYETGDSGSSLTPQALAAGDIATRPEGRWDTVIGTTIKTQSALNAHAAFDLAAAQVLTPAYTVQLRPGAWRGPSWLWLGDTVKLVITSGRLMVNASYQVSEMDFDISPDGLETLTVTLGLVPFRLAQEIPQMLRRLRNLELR